MRQVIALLMLYAAIVLQAHGADNGTLELGRTLTEQFYSGQTDILWQRFNTPMRDAMTSKENLAGFQRQVINQLGAESEVLSESVSPVNPYQVYLRSATFERGRGPVIVQWTVTDDQKVAGFFIRPASTAPSPYLDYQTQASLQLPFEGEWMALWGGREIASNYHARAIDQRFAYDFVKTRNGSSFHGEGTSNTDYYCFGQPILAPAAGSVVAVENDVADNRPGIMNPLRPMGNHIILDHGNQEYSFLAHFKQDSVEVNQGEQVAAGDVLGLCGNSGNSSEPHLHYHLQNTPEPFAGEGLPAQFNDYLANGELVERGEPVKGQRIQPE
ncbi:hypothetical protein RE428_48110 [Marinobacter nanhaiticus D15-8W]|nr:M23 family metallopeptidase [Marinobacter nanhaiticus]BES73793.1 hypothetical protein RE428_48110 [Marinobacter nanhaiticus D15-8W]